MTQEQKKETLCEIITLLNAVMIDETFSARFAMQCRKFKKVVNTELKAQDTTAQDTTSKQSY